MTTTIKLRQLADTLRLQVKIIDTEDVILGKGDSHIYDHGDGQFGACVGHGKNAKHWNNTRKLLTKAGFEIVQDGDSEGCALFDPENAVQLKVALKAIEARKRRVLPDGRKQKLIASGVPFKPVVQGLIRVLESTASSQVALSYQLAVCKPDNVLHSQMTA